MSDFEQCSNLLQLDLISLWVNFSYELGKYWPDMTSYILDEVFWAILEQTPP